MSNKPITRYQYSPTFGATVTYAPVDSSLYKLVGQRSSLLLILDRNGFHIRAVSGNVEESMNYGYQFLHSIRVDKDRGLVLILTDSTAISFYCTFPRFTAADIWVNLAHFILTVWEETESQLQKELCLALLSSVDTSTVRVPVNYNFFEEKRFMYNELVHKMCLIYGGGQPRLMSEWIVESSPLSIVSELEKSNSAQSLLANCSSTRHSLLLPELREGMQSAYFMSWAMDEGCLFDKGDHLYSVGYGGEIIKVFADKPGKLIKKTQCGHARIPVGELIAFLGPQISTETILYSSNSSIAKRSDHLSANEIGTVVAPLASRKDLYKNTNSNAPPCFKPSFASIPETIVSSGDTLSDLFACLSNERHVQSFLSDLSLTYALQTSGDGSFAIRDEALHVSPFDESLYCQIVLENHRYSLADLYDKEQEEGERRASKGMKWGSLYGLFTLNPLIPFFASNQARVSAPKHKKLEELIPDPKLLFLQDHYSLISMTQAGTPPARLRRLILHPVTSGDQVYLRILPAIVTGDSVIPCQIFSFGGSYFMRPICAGISHQQPNYNARQIHRQYYHLRADGGFADTGMRINVKGGDIDTHRYKLYRFACDTRELEYYYIDYATEPGHVF